MRLSVEHGDPGFCAAAHRPGVLVSCDGEVIELAITADEGIGYVKYHVRGFDGLVTYTTWSGEEQFLVLEKYGNVEIDWEQETL